MMMSHWCWAVPQCVLTVINLPLRQVLHNILLLDQRFFSWKEFRCNGHMSYCTLAQFGHKTCFISLSLSLCHFTSINCSSLLSYQTILPLLSCRSKIRSPIVTTVYLLFANLMQIDFTLYLYRKKKKKKVCPSSLWAHNTGGPMHTWAIAIILHNSGSYFYSTNFGSYWFIDIRFLTNDFSSE